MDSFPIGARVDRFLESYVDSNRIAGAVALVVKDGNVVYERAVGWADKELRRPMTTDQDAPDRVAVQGSTSIAIMMLVEEARIALGNPVSRFSFRRMPAPWWPLEVTLVVSSSRRTMRLRSSSCFSRLDCPRYHGEFTVGASPSHEMAESAICARMGASTVWIPGSGWCWCSCSNQLPNSTDNGQKFPTIVYQALAR